MRRLAEANLRKVQVIQKFLIGTLVTEFRGESPWIPWFPSSQSIYIYLIYSSQKKYIYKRGRREGIRIYKEFRLFYIEFEYPYIRTFRATRFGFPRITARFEKPLYQAADIVLRVLFEKPFLSLISPNTSRVTCPVRRTKGT